jgi:hypothetical protein
MNGSEKREREGAAGQFLLNRMREAERARGRET